MRPVTITKIQSATQANETRRKTAVSGGNPVTLIPLKKNEPTHRTDKARIILQSRALITVLIDDLMTLT